MERAHWQSIPVLHYYLSVNEASSSLAPGTYQLIQITIMDTPTDEKLNIAAAQYAHANDDYGDLFTLLYNTFVAGAEWQLNHPTSDYAWKIYNFIGDYKSGKFGEDLTLQQAIDKYFNEEQQ